MCCLLFGICLIIGCGEDTSTAELPIYFSYRVVEVYPHDHESFTQGLVFEDGMLYEGTGRRGKSSLRRVELETGNTLQTRRLSPEFFGEGIAIIEDRIIQLTWKSNVGFVYSKEDFELLRQFHYPWEGWGLTYDGEYLIMSDGTEILHFLDPLTFEEVRSIEVLDGVNCVSMLNELEYVDGEVYANVWNTDLIARISSETGQVLGWIDLQGLLTEQDRSLPVDVLNGIAYDAEMDRLFVTGKLWPKLFQIELVQQE
ncbi:MAG: glutaminyl-peptide cyclotransferase [Chloroflexota bacterium]|nr:glutaminyl-peptide cyclotransferase [Chloroflexota bacterium]